MKHSESIAHLATALVAAQADIRAVEKSATNPHFKSKYVPLDSIVAMARPVLAKHGLAVVQSAPSEDGNSLQVETMLVHTSGEWLSNEVCIPLAKRDPQGSGAAVTYGRRFGLSSLLSLTSEDDDDGNAASQPAKRAERPAPSQQAAQPVVNAQAAAPSATAIPEDQVWNGKRLGDMEEGELAALAMQMREKKKNGWLRAISAVRTNRQLGTVSKPIGPAAELSDDASVARMQAQEDAFQSTLPG